MVRLAVVGLSGGLWSVVCDFRFEGQLSDGPQTPTEAAELFAPAYRV